MQVIPAINAADFKTAEELIKKAVAFLPPTGGWIHIDVGDGKFSSITTWDKPEEFLILKNQWPQINAEVHLMVVDPLNCLEAWLKAGSKRSIVHVETIKNSDLDSITNLCQKYGADLMLATNPTTSVESLESYINKVNYFQVLAVDPGKAGQVFEPLVLEKIKLLRQKAPNVRIEVDGGINPETARAAKEAGADITVSASYIFDSNDFVKAYKELQNV